MILAVFLLPEGGHCQANASKNSPYRVLDSRAQSAGSDPQIFWIDDSEIVFLGVRDLLPPTQPRIAYTVNRWNIRTGAVTTIREFGETAAAPGLCFHQGFLSYGARRSDGVIEFYAMKVGEPERPADAKAYGRFCRPVREVP